MANPTTTNVTTGGTTSSTLSEWAGPYVTNMLGQTQAFSQQPYQVYQGPLTAGVSPLQQQYFQGIGTIGFPGNLGQSFTGSETPGLPSASTQGPIAAPQATGIAAQYMNPYLQAVLQPQLQEMRRQAQISDLANAAKATTAGAYGGSRQALMGAETQRNLMGGMQEAIGKGYATAYDKGLGQFNIEQDQAKALADRLAAAGTAQRGIEQEGITADYNEFLQQRDYPMKMLQFQQSMLQGMPISTQTSTPQTSALTGAMQTAGGLMDLYNRLFGSGSTPK